MSGMASPRVMLPSVRAVKIKGARIVDKSARCLALYRPFY